MVYDGTTRVEYHFGNTGFACSRYRKRNYTCSLTADAKEEAAAAPTALTYEELAAQVGDLTGRAARLKAENERLRRNRDE